MGPSLGLVGWGWLVMVCAFGLGVGEFGVVGRGLRLQGARRLRWDPPAGFPGVSASPA